MSKAGQQWFKILAEFVGQGAQGGLGTKSEALLIPEHMTIGELYELLCELGKERGEPHVREVLRVL